MSLPQQAPGGGSRRTHTHFTYVGTPHGKNWHAWIAGPCHWYLCHSRGKTKPCLHEMTGGELVCPMCESGQLAEETGYQPLYREVDAKPVMVIVHGYAREVVDAIQIHKRVLVGRGSDITDGVYVIPAMVAAPRYHSTLPERMVPADLTETLLRVWRLPELMDWYRQTHGRPATPASAGLKPAKTPLKSDGQPFSAWTAKAAEKAAEDNAAGGDGEVFDVLKERMLNKVRDKKPSTNGKHPPKG